MNEDRKPRPPVEYDDKLFESHGIAIKISTSRTPAPRVSVSIGRRTRKRDEQGNCIERVVPWVPWEQLDDVLAAFEELRRSEHAAAAQAAAEKRAAAFVSRPSIRGDDNNSRGPRRGRGQSPHEDRDQHRDRQAQRGAAREQREHEKVWKDE